MSKVIATIRLRRGHAGFYDDLSGIHLTIGRPTAQVMAGTNCSQLRRSVKAGTIDLIEGSFGKDTNPYCFIRKDDGSLAITFREKFEKAVESIAKADAKTPAEPAAPAPEAEKAEPVVEKPVEAEAPKAEAPKAEEVKVEEPAEEETPVEEKPVEAETEEVKADNAEEPAEEKAVETEKKASAKKKATKKANKADKPAE